MKNHFVLQKFQTSKEVSLVLNTTITFFFFLTDAISNFVSLNQVRYFFKIILPVYELFLQPSSCICSLVFVFYIPNTEELFRSDRF